MSLGFISTSHQPGILLAHLRNISTAIVLKSAWYLLVSGVSIDASVLISPNNLRQLWLLNIEILGESFETEFLETVAHCHRVCEQRCASTRPRFVTNSNMASQGQSSRSSSHIPSSPETLYPSSRQSSISSRPSKRAFHERILVNSSESHSVDDTRNHQYPRDTPDLVQIGMDRLPRPLSREVPGDPQRTHQEKELARKKSQYYEDTFATRPSQSSARERVLRETVVLAEIVTNVTVCPYSLPF